MIRSAIITLVILFSCSGKKDQLNIGAVDRILIIDNESKFSHTETRKEVVEGFKQLLEGQPEPTDCMPQGMILFKTGDSTILQAGYYKDASACNFLIVGNGDKKMGYRLTPNALKYLGLYFQKLKKQGNAGYN